MVSNLKLHAESRKHDVVEPNVIALHSDMRIHTMGENVSLTFPDGSKQTFTAGKPMITNHRNDTVNTIYQSGEIITPSGHMFHAILEFSTNGDILHDNTGILFLKPDNTIGMVWQHSSEYKVWLANMQRTVSGFKMRGYKHRYYIPMIEDRYIDKRTGWSLPLHAGPNVN